MIIRLPIGMLGSNTYLLYDDAQKASAVIDPGGDTTPLFEEIEKRGLDIRYLLNTHAHFDHIAANSYVKAKFDVPLGLHPADRALLLEGGGASWFDLAYVPSPPPDIELVEGKVLELGNLHIEVLHTPGHTPGSVCLYVPEENALFSGDTLFAESVGRTDLPGGEARRLTESLRKLLTLPEETDLYPGHGSATTLSRARRFNPWLRRIRPHGG
ncbi:MAG: MBL fold metallo-hydrolase [Anaerolineae bacterium]